MMGDEENINLGENSKEEEDLKTSTAQRARNKTVMLTPDITGQVRAALLGDEGSGDDTLSSASETPSEPLRDEPPQPSIAEPPTVDTAPTQSPVEQSFGGGDPSGLINRDEETPADHPGRRVVPPAPEFQDRAQVLRGAGGAEAGPNRNFSRPSFTSDLEEEIDSPKLEADPAPLSSKPVTPPVDKAEEVELTPPVGSPNDTLAGQFSPISLGEEKKDNLAPPAPVAPPSQPEGASLAPPSGSSERVGSVRPPAAPQGQGLPGRSPLSPPPSASASASTSTSGVSGRPLGAPSSHPARPIGAGGVSGAPVGRGVSSPPTGGVQAPPFSQRPPAQTVQPQRPQQSEDLSDTKIVWEEEAPVVGFLVAFDKDSNGDVFKLQKGRLLVTSDPNVSGNLLLIKDETVSEPHAILKVTEEGQIQVLDQLSDNGTKIIKFSSNTIKELSGDKGELEHGDIVFFGEREFHVCLILRASEE